MTGKNLDHRTVADSRRDFLKVSGVALACTAFLPELLSSQPNPAAAQDTGVPRFELDEASIATLQLGLKSGEYTSKKLVEMYLSRIEAIDRHGPSLNAVIEINPDAAAIADQVDAERKAKGPRGPLHGIPVLIKDNIATADKMQTTAGSLSLVGSIPPHDSAVAAKLRAAGAVILGKTNLSEWANLRSSHSTSGWSGRGGLTKNPYALDRNPSGSSSGSGTAVASNLCAVAVGSETDGSIVSPSNNCGLVGIKPTVGLIARTGIIPISHTQDTAGPMTRTVADAAALLSILTGVDGRDPATAAATGHIEPDYTKFLDKDGLRGARIGVVRKYAGFNTDVDSLFDEAIGAMKHAGAEIIDPAEIPTIGKFDDAELLVLLYEFKDDLNRYLAWLGASTQVHTMKDVIEFNDDHRDQEMPYFGQDLMVQSEAKGPLTTPEYVKALDDCRRQSRTEGIDAVMDKFKLNALIAPTGGPAWTTDLLNGDHTVGGSSTLAAVAGYPNINVPMGFTFGMPVGISFFGRAWSEPTLIRLAYAYEQLTNARKPPSFLPVADLSLNSKK
ncbi:MAG TPA: amidase [Terriglobales bacterium]